MEESIASTKFSSYTQSGIISKIFFTWIFKDLWKGFRGKLSKDDIHIPKNVKADNVVERLERKWTVEVFKGRCSLLRVLVEEFGANALFASLLNFGKYCFGTLTQIYCLGLLVDTFDSSKPDDFLFQRYISASIIVAVTLGIICFLPHSYFMAEVTGMKISTGCSSLVFQKILRISTAEMARLSVGHLISVISNDVAKLDYMCRATLTRLLDPLIIVSYVVLLTFIIGTPALAAVAVIVVFLIINMFIGRLFKKMRKQRALATDQRIKFTAEMVSEVKAVKMLSWEDAYYKIIDKFRQLESKYLKKICVLRTVGAVQTMISTQTSFFVVLVTIVLVGDEITPKKVFTSYAGFASLRTVVVILMGRAFEQLAYGLVSIERIRKMLLICEMNSKNQLINPNNDGNTVLKFESAWFQSSLLGNSPQELEQFRLNIGLHIPKSSMTVIAGPVGSGKSSLLLTMANELCMFSGGVILGGRISYLPQRPWLFPATIKQNILFGLPFDQTRYSNVISACAIDQDLAAFEKGDGTIVDDKGLTLSGGQKARICLARCLYRDCDIYLLDDPLSAVDVRVESHIYKNCFLEKKTDKTFVLVSHRLRNVTDDVNFAYLEKGRILNQGLYGDVKHQITSFSEHMATDENVDSVPEAVFEDVCLSSVPVTTPTNSQLRLDCETVEKPRQTSGNPYVIFFKMAVNCCNGFGAILLVTSIGTLAQACSSYFDIAVAIWTNKVYQDSTLSSTTSSQNLMVEQLYFLGCILLAEIILFGVCYGMFYMLCLKASKSLHRNMLKRVLRADMKFFDSNRTGEIINKFSKDLENLDDILPLMLVEASRCTWNCLGILVNVAYSNYITIGPMVICIIMCIIIAKMYSRSIKIIKHAEADARGPMYTYMNISIQGLAVIRAHDNQTRVSREFNWHQDNHTSTWFLMRAVVDWIGMATEVLSSFITISVIVIVLTLPDTMTGSKIGLGISSMLLFGDLLEHGINQFIESDNQIISAKRIQSYAELPEEDERTLVSDKSLTLPPNWPQRGAVVFKDVHLYYGSKSVLKSINFSINPGEKIGVVGRTGAGKSSVVTALFRMAPFTGSITIDDIDVQSVPMADYRKKLSVIPQTPVILAGSIRYNLDPSNEHSDEQLWSVLESVHLKGCIEKMGVGLQTEISHLSVGEKQLCSLARVILRNNMVIVLDEATSNVDNKIDQELQTIIKQRFKNSTMLIIAHRLETIMDTDRVMVLHNGEILEFDKPSTLLNNPRSIFKKMVSQTNGRM